MGQKVNPHGMRVGVIKNWDSRWYAKDEVFGDTLVSDYNIRKYLKKTLQDAGIPKIEIERDSHRVRVFIHCAKPGMVIGKGGSEIDKYKKTLEEMTGMPVALNVVEVRQPDMNAQLVAENIASQLERRVSFRRAMKMAIRNTMRNGAKGIKISCGGRLGGAEIARNEHYHEGTIPLQTLRADIDYGFWEANTTYGKIGVKVWIYKGEILSEVNRSASHESARPDRKPAERRTGDRRGGGDRRGSSDRRPNGNGDRKGAGDRRGSGDRRGGDRGARAAAPRPAERTPKTTAAVAAPVADTATAPKEGGAN